MEYCRIAFMSIIMLFISACPGECMSDDLVGLNQLISSFEDQLIDSQDLAFFLATHGYDAVPKGKHVEVTLSGAVYRLIPNGEKPGLCDIIAW